MILEMLKCKIHRATVTDANLEYEGSITIDSYLMAQAGIIPFEKVAVYNVTNGSRFETYAIEGKAGSGTVCINGAAAHITNKGDLVIIAAYCQIDATKATTHTPIILLLDGKNRISKSSLR
mgnify:CR=1 FL=1